MNVPLPDVVGHEEIRELLGRAHAAGTLPQSILLHGPKGVGKERLGLWLAQLILCETPTEEPCGRCRACRLALRLEHPDLHWFFPLPRPDASTPEKLREKLEETRAAELQAYREEPLRVPRFDRVPAHYLAAVRTIQQLAAVRPALGSRKVFVVGDAELMVPQEASQEAANAFLKLLEEPPPSTTLILTSSQPGALLPTIRSRVLSLRAGTIPERLLRAYLERRSGKAAERAAELAAAARGSLTRAALAASPEGNAAEDATRTAGRELLLASLTSGPVARLAAANARKPAGARADLVAELDALASWLRDLAAVAAGAPDSLGDAEALRLLQRAVDRRGIPPAAAASAIDLVLEAREMALGNLNPQLIVADLLGRMQSVLIGSAAAESTT